MQQLWLHLNIIEEYKQANIELYKQVFTIQPSNRDPNYILRGIKRRHLAAALDSKYHVQI